MNTVVQAIMSLYAKAKENQHFCVAYSGGIDSQVLLHALVQFKPPSVKLRAIHIHHGLQTMADAWADHCEEQAKYLNLPLQIKRVDAKADKGQSPEAAAREARYAAFSELLTETEILLTAHNQNDQAETFLLQLLRGAGLKGLAAMPFEAPFASGKLFRPLLDLPRAAITDYANQHQLSWIEDPSNENTQFDRNFLRQKIMPILMERWPSAARTIARSAKHCAQAWDLIEEVVQEDYSERLTPSAHPLDPLQKLSSRSETDSNNLQQSKAANKTPIKSKGEIEASPLSIEKLLTLSVARQHQLIRYWLESQHFSLPSAVQLERIFQDLILAAEDKIPLIHWSGVELRRFKGYLYAMAPLEPFDSQIELTWDGHKSLALPADLGFLQSHDPRLEPIRSRLNSTHSAIKIRFRQGGESMRIPGREGRHELKKLFQEWQVLPWRRDRIPLLYIDDELSLVLFSALDLG